MIIATDFPDHEKTHLLLRLLGEYNKDGVLYLLRIWSRCQLRMTDEIRNDPVKLAALCKFEGDPDVLYSAMLKSEWLKAKGNVLIAAGFREHQNQLFSKWRNGKRGGRPRKTEEDTEPNSDSVSSSETSNTTAEPNSDSVSQESEGSGKPNSDSVSSKEVSKEVSKEERVSEEDTIDNSEAIHKRRAVARFYEELHFCEVASLKYLTYEIYYDVVRSWWSVISLEDIKKICVDAVQTGRTWSGVIDQPGLWLNKKFSVWLSENKGKKTEAEPKKQTMNLENFLR